MRPRDLDNLLLGDRQTRAGVRIDIRVAELGSASRAVFRMCARRRSQTAPARRRARCFPSPTGPARATAPGRSSRRRHGARRAVLRRDRRRRRASSARIGCSAPGEDGHQRALAGAVLTDQRAHFAGGTSRSTPSTAMVAPNRLRDAAHREARRAGGGSVIARDRDAAARCVSGWIHDLARDQPHAGVDAPFDLFAFQCATSVFTLK